MPRYFTLRQAESLLPQIESKIREALYLKSEHERAGSQLRATAQKIHLSGGARIDHAHVSSLRSTETDSAQRLEKLIEDIHDTGCLVKDLDVGLLDFPTLYHGEEVYLCWRLGEPHIEHWHRVEDGFPGRKSIDREFLDNHSGE